MKINPDDPRLTAYALGELDENERTAFESELRESPECLRAVEEIRRTANLLSGGLEAEAVPELSAAQREGIEDELLPANAVRLSRKKVYWTASLTALAAVLALVLTLHLLPTSGQKAMKTASGTTSSVEVEATPPSPLAAKAPQPPSGGGAPPPPGSGTGILPVRMESKTERKEPATVSRVTPVPINDANAQPMDRSGKITVVAASENKPGQVASSISERSVRSDTQKLAPIQLAQTDVPSPDSMPRPASAMESVRRQAKTVTLADSTVAQADSLQPGAPTEQPAGGIVTSGGIGQIAPGPIPNGAAIPQGAFPPAQASGQLFERLNRPANMGTPVTMTITPANGEAESSRTMSADGWTFHPTPKVPELGDVPELGRLFRSKDQGIEGTATYPHLQDNTFLNPLNHPLSTFSVDVDTASYANVRRFLNEDRLPPRDAVRIEEMINYFSYDYPPPRGDAPFSASIEVAGCPWNPEHRLARIGIKGREIARDKRPPSNFVFLIDVSGSMQPEERLPLIQQALRALVKKMNEHDRVAIVVYASQAGVKLPSTPCSEKDRILRAIDDLRAGGSTNGGDGIQQAYRVAEENFIEGGVNRVLLCTDGDFNVGVTDQRDLVQMIRAKAKSGVFLTTLGVGTDNYKDALMQQLADKGNGNYAYLDSLEEAQKVLVDQMSGTLVTIAKDVKLQVEFNPAQVNAYRLIGYEKRLLRPEDFNNDARDAGEIGAGHTVTALYEIVPTGQAFPELVDDLKYQHPVEEKPVRYVTTDSKELLTLKIRYKEPDGDRSRLLEFPVTDKEKRFDNATPDFKFAAAVSEFGMLLRDSEFKGDSSYNAVLKLAEESKGPDENGYRSEFINLVRKARQLDHHENWR